MTPAPDANETERMLAEADRHVHADRYGYLIEKLCAKVRELQGELTGFYRTFAGHVYVTNEEYAQLHAQVRDLTAERDAAQGEAKWLREALGTLVKRWEIRAQDAANSSRRSYGEYDSGQERAYDDCIDGLRAALTAHQPAKGQ